VGKLFAEPGRKARNGNGRRWANEAKRRKLGKKNAGRDTGAEARADAAEWCG